jgi:hypothetical protein
MAVRRGSGGRGAEQNRALQMLAGASHRCTVAIMLVHGLTAGLLVGLVRDGLSTGRARTAIPTPRTEG